MADISKINPNGTEYNIKDEVARGMVESIITETNTTNTTPYLYRASQTTGDRLYDKLVGCSFGVNQLVQNGNFSDGTTGWTASGGSASASSGTVTITANGGNVQFYQQITQKVTGHKVLVSFDCQCTESKNLNINWGNTLKTVTTPTNKQKIAIIGEVAGGNDYFNLFVFSLTANSTVKYSNVRMTDLTVMFGTAIADKVYAKEQASVGSGIVWLKSYGFFTKDYYPYNAGSLVSVKPTAHRFTGINLFGGKRIYDTMIKNFPSSAITIQDDSITFATGSPTYDKQIIEGVFESNTVYTFIIKWKTNNASNTYLNLHIKYTDGTITRLTDPDSHTSSSGTAAFVSQSNKTISCLGADWSTGSTTIYTNSSGVFKGAKSVSDFEPYTEHTYPLTTELRGVPTLVNGEIVYDGDINEGDGSTVRKYLHQNLGDLNWEKLSSFGSGGDAFATTNFTAGKIPASENNSANISCSKYVAVPRNTLYGSSASAIAISATGRIIVRDTSYSDAASFKTAMSGVYADIELATPTTEASIPFTNPQICDKNGTEEYIDSRDVPIPVGHDTKYVDLPDWMEDGYYKDFRQRVDETIVKKLDEVSQVLTTTDNANYNTALDISAYDATKPIFGYVSVISNLSAGVNFYIPFSFMKDVVPAGTHNCMGVQGAYSFLFQFTDSPRSIKMVQARDANGNDATTNNTIKFYLYRNY